MELENQLKFSLINKLFKLYLTPIILNTYTMKKTNQISKLMTGTIMIPLSIMLFFLFIQTSLNAQSPSIDPVIQEYVESNQDSPIVKFYQANPDNQTAMHAIRNSIILSNEKDNMNQAEIDQMEEPINAVLIMNKEAEILVEQGISYERAAQTVSEKSRTEGNSNLDNQKATPSNIDGIPVMVLPNNQ